MTASGDRKHRCGGSLVPRDVAILDEKDGLSLGYVVPGLVCEKCHDELIERETALKLQGSQTPTIYWKPPASGTTQLTQSVFALLPAQASTAVVAA